MADGEEYNPNIGVPNWVNIVVPIVTALIFLLVLIILYRTEKEVAVEKIEFWIERVPLLRRVLLPDDHLNASKEDPAGGVNEHSHISPSHNDKKRTMYDSISSIHTEASSVGNPNQKYRNSFYFGSQGTLVSFESNV